MIKRISPRQKTIILILIIINVLFFSWFITSLLHTKYWWYPPEIRAIKIARENTGMQNKQHKYMKYQDNLGIK